MVSRITLEITKIKFVYTISVLGIIASSWRSLLDGLVFNRSKMLPTIQSIVFKSASTRDFGVQKDIAVEPR